MLQYPDVHGAVLDYRNIVNMCHRHEIKVAVAADFVEFNSADSSPVNGMLIAL
ncbi:MAG: hypothetical protein R2847_02105 [Bacteroidia bacterium]